MKDIAGTVGNQKRTYMAKSKTERPKSKAKVLADVSRRSYLNKEDGTLMLALLEHLKADVFIQACKDGEGEFGKKVTINRPMVFIVDSTD